MNILYQAAVSEDGVPDLTKKAPTSEEWSALVDDEMDVENPVSSFGPKREKTTEEDPLDIATVVDLFSWTLRSIG